MPAPALATGRVFMSGNEAAAWAAIAAGAQALFGYPITPQTEIMQYWAKLAPAYGRLFLQTEDELSAGYYTLGAVMTGKKAFTSTAGPGNVLMQEPMAMAEMMRLPAVFIIQQRGGPSTATVIYSQQETTLTVLGGNGEGLRIVYSTASHQELFDYTIKAFDKAWQYRFPAFVLGDGYQGKMKEALNMYDPAASETQPQAAYPLTGSYAGREVQHYRNTYNTEEELYQVLQEHLRDYDKMAPEVVEWEEGGHYEGGCLLISHGIVSRSCAAACRELARQDGQVGFFRPITLRPFPVQELRQAAAKAQMLLVVESAQGQLCRLVTEALYGLKVPLYTLFRPGVGITAEEVTREAQAVLAGRCRHAGLDS